MGDFRYFQPLYIELRFVGYNSICRVKTELEASKPWAVYSGSFGNFGLIPLVFVAHATARDTGLVSFRIADCRIAD